MIFRQEPYQTGLAGHVELAETEFGGAAASRPLPLDERVKRKLRASIGRRGLIRTPRQWVHGTPHAESMACALASTSGSFSAMSPSSRAAATVG